MALAHAQDRAFQELWKAMTIVTGMFLSMGGPSKEQMDRAKNAQTNTVTIFSC